MYEGRFVSNFYNHSYNGGELSSQQKKKGKAKRKLCKNKKIKICKPKGDYSKKLNKKCDANKKATTEVNYQGLFLPTDRPEVDWYYL